MGKQTDSSANAKKTLAEDTIVIEYEGKVFSESIPDSLRLRELTPREINERLNIIPGRYAYWKALGADIQLQIEEQSRDYDAWYAKAYMLAKSANEKSTETLLKNAILLENATEYNKRNSRIEHLKMAASKVDALVRAFDLMSRTLVALAGMTRAEMGNLQPSGRGSLDL